MACYPNRVGGTDSKARMTVALCFCSLCNVMRGRVSNCVYACVLACDMQSR